MMGTPLRKEVRACLLSLPLVLASCGGPNDKICGNSLATNNLGLGNPKDATEARAYVIGCVEHWAARLAKSKQDNAKDAAHASLDGCSGRLADWQRMAQTAPNSPESEQDRKSFEEHALFIVIQTRAGNCYPDG